MKSYIKTVILVLLSIPLTNCQTKQRLTYANQLEGCLSIEDINLINLLCTNFEENLVSKYQLDINGCYQQFLTDVGDTNFPSNFFIYDSFRKDMVMLRKSKFFSDTWIKESKLPKTGNQILEIPPTTFDEPLPQKILDPYDPNVFNPNGQFFDCLKSKNRNQVINDYLDAIKLGVEISPAFMAKALDQNFTQKDYNNELNKLIVAITFHYHIGLMLTDQR